MKQQFAFFCFQPQLLCCRGAWRILTAIPEIPGINLAHRGSRQDRCRGNGYNKSPVNGGLNGKNISQLWIFHCHVWLSMFDYRRVSWFWTFKGYIRTRWVPDLFAQTLELPEVVIHDYHFIPNCSLQVELLVHMKETWNQPGLRFAISFWSTLDLPLIP